MHGKIIFLGLIFVGLLLFCFNFQGFFQYVQTVDTTNSRPTENDTTQKDESRTDNEAKNEPTTAIQDWNEYRNAKYWYSFQYPKDYFIQNTVGEYGINAADEVMIFSNMGSCNEPCLDVRVAFFKNLSDSDSLEKIALEFREDVLKENKENTSDFDTYTTSDLFLATTTKFKAYTFTTRNDSFTKGYIVSFDKQYLFVEHSGHIFLITYTPGNEDTLKVLQSFKFLSDVDNSADDYQPVPSIPKIPL